MPENRCIRYAIVIVRVANNYSAYVPDLPGCIATGATIADVKREIADAVRFHIEGLHADDQPVPEPTMPIGSRQFEQGDDPFAAFTEWAGEADEAAYATR